MNVKQKRLFNLYYAWYYFLVRSYNYYIANEKGGAILSEVYDFGGRLRALREKRGLSQSQVAKRFGIQRAAISGYENNTSKPGCDRIAELALLYHTTTDYILGLDNRHVIVLDGLTEREYNAVTSIVDAVVAEFKAMKLR